MFKKILIASSMLMCMPLAAEFEFKMYAEKHELNSYDIAVLYSIFYKLREDPNDKTIKIATVNQELIDNGIPLTTIIYAKMAYSKGVNEVLAHFNDDDLANRVWLVWFVDWAYNLKDRVYKVMRTVGGIVGVLCLAVIINKCLT